MRTQFRSTMPATRNVPTRTERSHEENQERAYVAASRRSDRSIEARMESAKRASEIHKKRTGRALRVTQADVENEEMYEEEDDTRLGRFGNFQLPSDLKTANPDYNLKLEAFLKHQFAIRQGMGPVMSNYQSMQRGLLGDPGAFSPMMSNSLQQDPRMHQPPMSAVYSGRYQPYQRTSAQQMQHMQHSRQQAHQQAHQQAQQFHQSQQGRGQPTRSASASSAVSASIASNLAPSPELLPKLEQSKSMPTPPGERTRSDRGSFEGSSSTADSKELKSPKVEDFPTPRLSSLPLSPGILNSNLYDSYDGSLFTRDLPNNVQMMGFHNTPGQMGSSNLGNGGNMGPFSYQVPSMNNSYDGLKTGSRTVQQPTHHQSLPTRGRFENITLPHMPSGPQGESTSSLAGMPDGGNEYLPTANDSWSQAQNHESNYDDASWAGEHEVDDYMNMNPNYSDAEYLFPDLSNLPKGQDESEEAA